MIYVLAASFPPVALLWCRRPGQALLNALLLAGAIAGDISGAPGAPVPALLAIVAELCGGGALHLLEDASPVGSRAGVPVLWPLSGRRSKPRVWGTSGQAAATHL